MESAEQSPIMRESLGHEEERFRTNLNAREAIARPFVDQVSGEDSIAGVLHHGHSPRELNQWVAAEILTEYG
jgi:hypothetical protein